MSCEASTLDWISGVVVPIILGVFTLGVAVWAALLARQSNELNRRIAEASARDRRAPFAAALWHRAGAMIAARAVGRDPLNETLSDLERLQADDALRIRSDEPSARDLSLWASLSARKSPADSVDDYIALQSRIVAIVELWVFDPAKAMRTIDADEWFAQTRAEGGGPG